MKNIYQLNITLEGLKPAIYRKVLVEDSKTFYELHYIIQIAMGWDNSHLYQFEAKDLFISDPTMIDNEDILDAKEVTLKKIFTREGMYLQYEYDFGDRWVHTVKLEKIVPVQKNESYPKCIEGKRNCPPEDCGGIWGYDYLLKVIGDKNHPEYKEMMEWLGDDFDPEYFNIKKINKDLLDIENYIKDSMFEIE